MPKGIDIWATYSFSSVASITATSIWVRGESSASRRKYL